MTNRGQAELRELAEAAAIVVVGVGAFFLISSIDFGSTSTAQSTDNLTRFIWAVTHLLAPTSEFALFVETILALVGFVTVSRVDARAAIFAGFFTFFGTSFMMAWFAAPV